MAIDFNKYDPVTDAEKTFDIDFALNANWDKINANIINNLTTTAAGSALDAVQGKALKEEIDSKIKGDNAIVDVKSSTDNNHLLFMQKTDTPYSYITVASDAQSASMGLPKAWHRVVYLTNADGLQPSFGANGYGVQLAFCTSVDRLSHWERFANGKNWTAWIEILKSDKIANNLTTTTAGSVLDAAQGKVLKDQLDGKLPLTGGTMTGGLVLVGSQTPGYANINGQLLLQMPTTGSWARGVCLTDTSNVGYAQLAVYGTGTSMIYALWGIPATHGGDVHNSPYCIRIYPDGRLQYGNEKIWHSGNDGAGSGLDADTLDGKHLSNIIVNNLTTTTAGTALDAAQGKVLNDRVTKQERVLSATLTAAGWSAAAPYTQTVNVSGITANDVPVIGVILSGTADQKKAQQAAWNMVSEIDTGAGNITATCLSSKPVVNIVLQIKGA